MTYRPSLQNYSWALAVACGAFLLAPGHSIAADYVQTNLVSDIPGLAAITDPNLVNSWGASESGTSPMWISNQGTSTSTLYSITGSTTVAKVNINPPAGDVLIPITATGAQGPTGQVNNSNTSSFSVGGGGDGQAAHFIFANLNGTISAWDTGATAFVQATAPGGLTGLAINAASTRLYAAGATGIDVFDSAFSSVALSGSFIDPSLPNGFVPFNVRDINGKVYVTYAPSGHPAQIAATAGQGFVAVFDENGNFLQELISGGQLAAPWGIALAPSNFGDFSGDLLVGNFSFADSEINAFDPSSGTFEGTIPIDDGANTPGGLWNLTFGNGGSGGALNTLYITDGLNGETDGLVAAIAPVPEPASFALLGIALTVLGVARSRSRQPA